MRSAVLLGLTAGLAANVQAHPQRRAPHVPRDLSKRGVDIESLRMPDIGRYQNSQVTKDSDEIQSIGKRSTYLETAAEVVERVIPGADFRVVEDHYVGRNGVAHVTFKQMLHGVDIDNADFRVNIAADGSVLSFGNSFYTGEEPAAMMKRDVADPTAALKQVVDALGLPINAPEDVTAVPVGAEEADRYALEGTSGAMNDPQASLVYLIKSDGELALTWRVETDVLDNWLLTYIDAQAAAGGSPVIHAAVDYVSDIATYEVYPWPIFSPVGGERVVLEDPWLLDTSEFTWISDGSTNYTTTRGNNGIAQVNPSGGSSYLNNYRPQDPELTFEYPYSPAMEDPTTYRDASITQLFYTANKYHDLLEVLGFDETSGNFQTNNNDQGGAGGDFVILNSQDGSGTNNANFATPPDGQTGRMRMYLFNYEETLKDCSFDASVVIHEYTHGLSNRLTGGPANSGCLGGLESGGMGEGWSDFMATAIRLLPNDTRSAVYPIGEWVASDPGGIRAYPYATSLDINPFTYASANTQTRVHGIGTIWCTMLYEVLWNLIDKRGNSNTDLPAFDESGLVPTDGRFLAMQLVMDGMALQPCNPTFVSARDAILDADEALTGGDNACEIWTGFAKRGLGVGARYSAQDRTEDFELPEGIC